MRPAPGRTGTRIAELNRQRLAHADELRPGPRQAGRRRAAQSVRKAFPAVRMSHRDLGRRRTPALSAAADGKRGS